MAAKTATPKPPPTPSSAAAAAAAAADTKPLVPPYQLLHNPGLAVEWSAEEQSILDDNLTKFASESNLWKYIRIAALLSDKTARDVALRCKWMSKKENGKRRRLEEQNASRRPKDSKKDRALDASGKVPGSNKTMYTTPPLPIDNDDGEVEGPDGELLKENSQLVMQIQANLISGKAQENIELFVRYRDNIDTINNSIHSVPGIMGHMPPLPVKINRELANALLPKSKLHPPTSPPR